MSGEEFFCCLNVDNTVQLTVYRNLTSNEEVELHFPKEITLYKTVQGKAVKKRLI
jgi:hypothetical protein